ncbi:MAG: D-glycero-beta-D-manno-heptose 1,7-bisphosphate 7-phosphatase [Gammaproteobacteria bacterium]|nr:D-glycero-beta-D-manno-heptose 1,7-bisphosphate 7-phosphatase [Gammaproteobacteria bacterium]
MHHIILGRDGVINEVASRHVRSPEEWIPIEGSLDAIARLNRAGFHVVVATNQPGLSRRSLNIEALNRIHESMHRQLAEVGGHVKIASTCPCSPKDDCDCFKPNPGMLLDVAARLRISLDSVRMVGDEISDIEAARAAGAIPVLVKTGNGAKTAEKHPDLDDVEVFEDLAEAADAIIEGLG